MDIEVLKQNPVTIVTIRGNVLGGPDALALNEKLHQLLEGEIRYVVLELSEVNAINSSGLGMLIGGLTTMRNAGGDLKIANASKKVEALVTISKLNNIFPNYGSVEEAVDSIQNSR